MNFLKLSLVAVFAFVLASCGDNVSKNCAQSNWVGTYTGTVDCDGTVENVTVTVTASGDDAIVIKYSTDFVDTEYEPLTPEGCDLDYSDTDATLGLTVSIDGTLDENNLNFTETISDGTDSSICTISATRN